MAATRIVYVLHSAATSPDGEGTGLLRLLQPLAGTDLRPLVALGEDGPLVADLERAGVEVRVLPRRRAGLDVGHIRRLRRLLREVHADLVHATSLHGGIGTALAARLAGVPLVWQVRDPLEDDPASGPSARSARLLLLLGDAVLVDSDATARSLGGAVRRSVGHRVLVDPYRPTAPATPRTAVGFPPRVALVGPLAPSKGQHLFLDAVDSLHATGFHVNAVLLTTAPSEEKEYAAALTERVDSSNPLIELGSFEGDVTDALRDVDAVVDASGTSSRVVVEALAHGVPVVLPDTGGTAELVTDGVSGLTYSAGDPLDLGGVLATLLEAPGLHRRLSANALTRARDFDPDTVAGDYRAFLDTVEHTGLPRRLARGPGRLAGRLPARLTGRLRRSS